MNSSAIVALLELVAQGRLSPNDAAQRFEEGRMFAVDGATIDLGRQARCGLPEVIYGAGKPAALVQTIAATILESGQEEVLITRLPAEAAAHVAQAFPHHRYLPEAQSLRVATRAIRAPETLTLFGPVAVITAGSTDRHVADEAAETLGWMGVTVIRLEDVGVAGPQRLLSALPQLRPCCAAVVVAGMEGALPSVVAGHVPYPVLAVPTSVGYGVALGGLTPLLSMLTSCAANVAVVNIDAGFKAGYLAGLIARQATKRSADSSGDSASPA